MEDLKRIHAAVAEEAIRPGNVDAFLRENSLDVVCELENLAKLFRSLVNEQEDGEKK